MPVTVLPAAPLGVMVSVSVVLCPGCRTTGANAACGFTPSSHRSPEGEAASVLKPAVVAVIPRLAVEFAVGALAPNAPDGCGIRSQSPWVIAGAEYGTGSSRDWAAKGTKLLGVRAVIAKSFERIHRSNLVGMGVLPLELAAGEGAETIGLTGRETFDIGGIAKDLVPGKKLQVVATAEDGSKKTFTVTCRIDTPNEVDYYQHGGILQFVLRQILASK